MGIVQTDHILIHHKQSTFRFDLTDTETVLVLLVSRLPRTLRILRSESQYHTSKIHAEIFRNLSKWRICQSLLDLLVLELLKYLSSWLSEILYQLDILLLLNRRCKHAWHLLQRFLKINYHSWLIFSYQFWTFFLCDMEIIHAHFVFNPMIWKLSKLLLTCNQWEPSQLHAWKTPPIFRCCREHHVAAWHYPWSFLQALQINTAI